MLGKGLCFVIGHCGGPKAVDSVEGLSERLKRTSAVQAVGALRIYWDVYLDWHTLRNVRERGWPCRKRSGSCRGGVITRRGGDGAAYLSTPIVRQIADAAARNCCWVIQRDC